jgi:hypothetical protein
MRNTRALSLLCLIAICAALAAAQQPGARPPLTVITDDSELQNLTPADILSLVREVASHPLASPPAQDVDQTKTSEKNQKKEFERDIKFCNSDAENDKNNTRSDDCWGVSSFLREGSPIGFWYKLRACALPYPDHVDLHDGQSHYHYCQAIEMELYTLNAKQAAVAFLENAPTCMYADATGNEQNTCLGEAIAYGHMASLYADDPGRARRLAHVECDQRMNGGACRYLQSLGEQVDLTASTEHFNEEKGARQEQKEAGDRAGEAREQAALHRYDSINATLESMPGSAPGSMQQTADQQAANLRAIGDANAARQQQQAQANLAAQQAAQQRAAQQAATERAQQEAAQQQANQNNSSGGNGGSNSSSPNSTGGDAHSYASPITTSCIAEFWDANNYGWLALQNNCGQPVHLTWIATSPTDTYGAASADIAVGQKAETGWSQDEVAAKQHFNFFICPGGYIAVDGVTHQAISSPNETFVCQKWE